MVAAAFERDAAPLQDQILDAGAVGPGGVEQHAGAGFVCPLKGGSGLRTQLGAGLQAQRAVHPIVAAQHDHLAGTGPVDRVLDGPAVRG